MKQKIFGMVTLCTIALLVLSCAGRSKNRKLVEAQQIHKTMMVKHDSIFDAVKTQEERVEKKLGKLSRNDPDRTAYQSMERSIKRSYTLLDSWKDGLTSVPGFEPEHTGKEHHDHNHSDKVNPKKLSDQEILDLQEAYSEKLDQISQKIDELITTMDMYTKE